jgi:hypothetical protein
MRTTTSRPHRSRAANVASGVFVVIAVISAVISASVYAPMEDPFEPDAQVLVASFGLGMALLTGVIAAIPFRAGQRWAWAVLWVWPAFFVWHVLALGTLVPDGVLAAVSAGALVATTPRAVRAPAATPDPLVIR